MATIDASPVGADTARSSHVKEIDNFQFFFGSEIVRARIQDCMAEQLAGQSDKGRDKKSDETSVTKAIFEAVRHSFQGTLEGAGAWSVAQAVFRQDGNTVSPGLLEVTRASFGEIPQDAMEETRIQEIITTALKMALLYPTVASSDEPLPKYTQKWASESQWRG